MTHVRRAHATLTSSVLAGDDAKLVAELGRRHSEETSRRFYQAPDLLRAMRALERARDVSQRTAPVIAGTVPTEAELLEQSSDEEEEEVMAEVEAENPSSWSSAPKAADHRRTPTKEAFQL